MNNLGIMYQCGNGVEQNIEEAIKYYKMAVEKGDIDAMYNLGSMYQYGDGVEQNYEEAIELYQELIIQIPGKADLFNQKIAEIEETIRNKTD